MSAKSASKSALSTKNPVTCVGTTLVLATTCTRHGKSSKTNFMENEMTNVLLTAPVWKNAACAGKDTDLFFPEAGKDFLGRIAEAKAVCNTCPIVADCLSWATENDEQGIWGASTYEERKRMSRRRRTLDKAKRAHLTTNNARRSQESASKSVVLVKEALDKLGSDVPDALMKTATLRLEHPEATLTELAQIANVTKDTFAGSLRRLLNAAKK